MDLMDLMEYWIDGILEIGNLGTQELRNFLLMLGVFATSPDE
ncbi:MAG: hypothetical protein PF436_01695 [Prolixibacteraceae bacterium]|jgi:hypothetical protein|nr:hypothetical protein [Prolixibacteraceae bacterium]